MTRTAPTVLPGHASSNPRVASQLVPHGTSDPTEALYRPLRAGPHGSERDHQQVLDSQRLRLRGAMVEAVAQLGYPSVTIAQIVRLAAVSKRSFYEHFSGKEECFIATFEGAVADLSQSIDACWDCRAGGEESLHALFAHCAACLEVDPKPIRLCVVDAPTAGPAARERLKSLRASAHVKFARAVCETFGADGVPGLAMRGVRHGIWHLLRSRLLAGDSRELAPLADELYEWLCSYRCPAGSLVGTTKIVNAHPARTPSTPKAPAVGDARRRLHRAALELAGRHGLAGLSERSLIELAGVRDEELRALYEDAHACFLDALGLLAAEALARIMGAARAGAGESWPTVVRASIAALIDWLVREPALARAAFVEAFDGGPDVQARTQYLIGGFASLLRRSTPESLRLSSTVAEGVVAGIWGALHDFIASGAIARLPDMTDELSYIVLAPAIGADRAIEALRPGPIGQAGGSG